MKKANSGFNFFFFAFSLLSVSILLFSACKKDESSLRPPNVIYDINASLNGKQAGVDTSKAKAEFKGTYSQRKLVYSITFSQIDPASVDLHQGTPTSIGELLVTLKKNDGNKYTSPLNGEITLTLAQEKALLRTVFVNLTSVKFTRGEIRGKLQVVRRP